MLVSHDRDFLDRVVTSVLAHEGGGQWIEYAGGYTDMEAQRGEAAPAPSKPSKPARRAKAERPPARPRRGLTFKQKHALATLPGEIKALEAKIGELRRTLEDPDLYKRDPAGFETAAGALDAAGADLARKEEDWLAAELLREELEGS